MEPIKYFSIKDHKFWIKLNPEATQLDKAEAFMSYHLDKTIDEVRQMPANEVNAEFAKILEVFEQTTNPQFYPLIEIEGKLHGYIDISQMTLGEYVDLEKLASNVNDNLAEIMAILYRPITKHRFDSIKYNIINTFNVASKSKNITNIWEYYELEPYTYANAVINTQTMEKLPVAFALGAVSFFLLQTSLLIKSSQDYSNKNPKMKMKEFMKMERNQMNKVIENNSVNIGGGLLQFIVSRQLPSLQSTGISVSQI
ncbi:MAG: hypothetical protein EBR82_50720 [Caulobacteraceae bacterium]|nr:hypothetical protein [Caulobacteraceae bacterium]